ncbi:MAG: hypothetical protein KY428_09785, partial [Bacteroidetes bacterium]|nr:hypothetical protein [Bacteroidota bacterium]
MVKGEAIHKNQLEAQATKYCISSKERELELKAIALKEGVPADAPSLFIGKAYLSNHCSASSGL